LCFSSHGKVYWLRVFDLPQAGRTARGRPIVNLLPLEEGERISTILPLQGFDGGGYVLMATSGGRVKKTPLEDFSRPRPSGIIALDLKDQDALVGVAITDGKRDVMLASTGGKVIRFNESQVRSMGRTARGVRGMRMSPDERVISLIIAAPGLVLTVTEKGYGKCTPVEEYRPQGRGGLGIISIRSSERNGKCVGAMLVNGSGEIMRMTGGGKLVRTRVDGISVLGRNTQGVKLISLQAGETLAGLERLVEVEDE